MDHKAGDLQLHVCRVLMLRLVPKELDGINPAREATRRQTLHAAADTIAAPACRSTSSLKSL